MTASTLNYPGGLIGFMVLKDRIQEAIDQSEKTKAEIARNCGVTNAAVTQWLSGDTANLKADKALALEIATGYRAQWILTGRGPKKLADQFWPFGGIPIERFERLDEKGRGYVDAKLEEAIEVWEERREAQKSALIAKTYVPSVTDQALTQSRKKG